MLIIYFWPYLPTVSANVCTEDVAVLITELPQLLIPPQPQLAFFCKKQQTSNDYHAIYNTHVHTIIDLVRISKLPVFFHLNTTKCLSCFFPQIPMLFYIDNIISGWASSEISFLFQGVFVQIFNDFEINEFIKATQYQPRWRTLTFHSLGAPPSTNTDHVISYMK